MKQRHFVCLACDAVVPSERCPAQGHWLELLIGKRKHEVVRCDGACLADRVGYDAARNFTMRHSLGLWTEEDLVEYLAVLKSRLDAAKKETKCS